MRLKASATAERERKLENAYIRAVIREEKCNFSHRIEYYNIIVGVLEIRIYAGDIEFHRNYLNGSNYSPYAARALAKLQSIYIYITDRF